MLSKRATSVDLLQILVACGLTVIGVAAGQEPAQTAVAAATTTVVVAQWLQVAGSVGSNLVSSLIDRGFQFWHARWAGDQGLLADPIAHALGQAFEHAFGDPLREWAQEPRYYYLKHSDEAEADRTIRILRDLQRNATQLFARPINSFREVLNDDRLAPVLQQNDQAARAELANRLRQYLFGYDEEFIEFVLKHADQMIDRWLIAFVEVVRDPQHGTAAWRALQDLRLVCLTRALEEMHSVIVAQYEHTSQGIGQLTQATTSIQALMQSLQEYFHDQASVAPEQRDPLGAETLRYVKELKPSVEAIHGMVARVSIDMERLIERNTPPTRADQLSNRHTTSRLFGPAVQYVNLDSIRPATDAQLNHYYQGAQLTWSVIAADGDVWRQQHDELLELLTQPRAGLSMLCLTGESGSGKTTLAWRLAIECAKRLHRPLLHLRDPGARGIGEAWYTLETGVRAFGAPLVLLVDDIFRDSDAQRILGMLDVEIELMIIATSRSNEVPGNLAWFPFQLQLVPLSPPTDKERSQVLRKLNKGERELPADQQDRLRRANSWLVMMLELTTGEALTKIVSDTVERLKQLDPIVYVAYEYLCFVGQYDLAIPSSLIECLNERGEFHDLLARPASAQLIFADPQWHDNLRTLHATIARASLAIYHRDPRVVLRDILRALQPESREHRLFIAHIFRLLLLDGKSLLVRQAFEAEPAIVQAIVDVSTPTELVHRWARIYRQLDLRTEAKRLEAIALDKDIETYIDWEAVLYLIQRRGFLHKIAAIFEKVIPWLANHPDDTQVRNTFLGLVERRGTPEQVAATLTETAAWLANHPDDTHVRNTFLGLVERRGTPEQVATVLTETAAWLANHPENVVVLRAYTTIVEHQEAPEPILRALGIFEGRVHAPKARLHWQMLSAYGKVLQRLERLPEAEHQFREALKLHKGDVETRISLAWCLYKLKRKQEALDELFHARYWAQRSTGYSVGGVLYHLGRYNLLEGHIRRAKDLFAEAMNSAPDIYTNYWQLAQVAMIERQLNHAYDYLQQAIARLPSASNNRDRIDIEKLRAWFEL